MLTTPDDTLLTREGWSRVDVYDTQDKEYAVLTGESFRDDHPSPYSWFAGLAWSADSEALAFSIGFDGFPSQVYVAEWVNEHNSIWRLSRPKGVEVSGGTVAWRGNSRDLCFSAEEKARSTGLLRCGC